MSISFSWWWNVWNDVEADFAVRWVKTDNGQAYADAVNVPEPPTDVEASVNKIFQLVCSISSFPLCLTDRC